jgi:predicted nucleotidyltransferase
LALFGSVARDEATAESDVDLLVEFEGGATFDRYMDLKFFLEECLGFGPIQLPGFPETV